MLYRNDFRNVQNKGRKSHPVVGVTFSFSPKRFITKNRPVHISLNKTGGMFTSQNFKYLLSIRLTKQKGSSFDKPFFYVLLFYPVNICKHFIVTTFNTYPLKNIAVTMYELKPYFYHISHVRYTIQY